MRQLPFALKYSGIANSKPQFKAKVLLGKTSLLVSAFIIYMYVYQASQANIVDGSFTLG